MVMAILIMMTQYPTRSLVDGLAPVRATQQRQQLSTAIATASTGTTPVMMGEKRDNDDDAGNSSCESRNPSWTTTSMTQRRRFLGLAIGCAGMFSLENAHAAPEQDDIMEDTTRIYQLKSGVQFRNVRMGQGPLLVEKSRTTSDDDEQEDQSTVVLLHVKATLRNGQTLLDTRQDGKPLLYTLGSALATPAPMFLVPPGLDDALLSRGVDAATGRRVPAMRQGGIRLVVVPAALGYGSQGLSRFQA